MNEFGLKKEIKKNERTLIKKTKVKNERKFESQKKGRKQKRGK